MKIKHYIYFIFSFIPVFIYNATILALAITLNDFRKEKKRLDAGGSIFSLCEGGEK